MKTALILRIAIALSRQVKLDFRGNDREKAVLVEAGHDVLQYRAWLKRAGVTVAILHRQQDLRGMLRILRTGTQRTGDRDAQPVGFIIKRAAIFPF